VGRRGQARDRVPSLIELQLDVLLARDTQGRLTTTRDPTPRPAPRLFLGRSGDGNVWALRQDLGAETSEVLRRHCAAEPRLITPRADSRPSCREPALRLLAPVESEYRGPAYVLPEGLPADDRAREVAADERSLWCDAFPWLAAEFDAVAPVAIAFAGGRPAAICHSPRGRTALAAEAGVETLAPFRGQGLATAAVACWARAVQQSGRIALYSTSWDNAASQAIARRLSARLYGENWHLS
jgi:RimJ/RimL family protein N-acetyltransferase